MKDMKDIDRKKLNLEQLYFKTEEYISELKFYRDDLTFLQHLLDKYFAQMIKIENLDEMRETMMRLQDIKYNGKILLENSEHHLLKITKLIDNSSKTGDKEIYPEHDVLEESVQSFKKKFRNTKTELFSIADHVLELQKKEKKIKEEK